MADTIKPWEEVEQSVDYLSLPLDEQILAKAQYMQEVAHDPIAVRELVDQYRKSQPEGDYTPMQVVNRFFGDVVDGKRDKSWLQNLEFALQPYNLPKIPSEYEAAANAAQDAMVNLVLGGSTPSPQMMRGEVDLVENPEAEAIEPAFMGMDTLTSAAVPKALQGYIKLAAKMAPDEHTFIKYLERVGVPNPQKYMTAFHGSPHKFSKFELDKIGTGEGAQAFGHGLYFAESPGVAKSYKSKLSNGPVFSQLELSKMSEAADWLDSGRKGSISDKAMEFLDDAAYDLPGATDKKLAKWLRESSEAGKGNIYEVDIPDSAIDNMLDWDKPLSEQSDYVKNALGYSDEYLSMGGKMKSGGQAYRSDLQRRALERIPFKKGWSPDQLTSEYLKSLGIPGIKYLDQGSRAAGEGTRNFVVFDDSILKVLSRNGEKVE